ncbi:MAG TPA: isoprenylcysteine carboxylmethyltransferase family protein [Candidatus Binataceae bacterium]|jgi:protein-S-isoprenylcysteine O-methyltransferase Ste14|nr:isoprenylcysteine carboxylmethyltransferase family protein [Candidatus Binataceae bacterium]
MEGGDGTPTEPRKPTGELKAPTGGLGPVPSRAVVRRWRRIDIRLSELIVFLVAVVGAVALGLGITEYFDEHPYIFAYLIAYAGFRLADVLVREDFEPPPDTAGLAGSILRQLPMLALFAAAPFERTYLYGGEVARWTQALGLLMEMLGLWLALGARIQLGFFSSTPLSGGPRTLVRNGLYGHVRHPIWLGEFLVAFAWTLEFGAPIVAVITIMFGTVMGWMRAASEEAEMLAEFGDEYARYMQEAECFIPGIW